VWVRDTEVLHRYCLEDINQVNYFGEMPCPELKFCLFPKSAREATDILGGFLNVQLFDPAIHTFDEGVIDDVESFEKQWKTLAKLKSGNFAKKSSRLPLRKTVLDVEYLTEKTLTPEVKEFLTLAGLPQVDFEDDHNDWFLEEFGEDARWELGNAVDNRDPVQYELIWQTEESMKRFFWPLSSATLLSLPHLIDQDIVKGRVADLGSGMGLTSCFMAWNWPECHVTAVEITPNGNIRAKEIAERLGITNIEFIEHDLGDIEQVSKFDLVTTFLTAHELASLNNLHEICGHASHSDEFAAINLQKYQSDYAQFVGDLLSDDGSVFSLERLSGMSEQCAWVGGLRNTGVYVDLEKSTFVYPFVPSWGHRERLPVFVGSRQETDLSMDSFDNWYNQYPFGKGVE
jgi:16S rRNA G527 N7-methylase RsmG